MQAATCATSAANREPERAASQIPFAAPPWPKSGGFRRHIPFMASVSGSTGLGFAAFFFPLGFAAFSLSSLAFWASSAVVLAMIRDRWDQI